MKVLLVASEFFSWGLYGGFGAFTRKLGKELVKRGVEVEAIVHRISDLQKPVGESEIIDGVKVTTLPRGKIAKFRTKLYRTDADIIHSQCGMFDTYMAFKRNPDDYVKKIVTVQDLRTKEEVAKIGPEIQVGFYKRWVKRLWARFVKRCYGQAIRTADVVACQALLLKPKIRKMFNVIRPIVFLPNFIDMPTTSIKKSKEPSVVWLGRLDPVKNPELYFEVAKKTPDVTFYVLGKSSFDKDRDEHLRNKYKFKNLKILGFQSGELKEQILSQSWILINTSKYECLPVSFLEASAYACAILSTQNPDDFTSRFGCHVSPDVNSIKDGLTTLLKDDLWRAKGKCGRKYVEEVHSTQRGLEKHIQLYKELILSNV